MRLGGEGGADGDARRRQQKAVAEAHRDGKARAPLRLFPNPRTMPNAPASRWRQRQDEEGGGGGVPPKWGRQVNGESGAGPEYSGHKASLNTRHNPRWP